MKITITTTYKLNDDEINTMRELWHEDIKDNLYWQKHNNIDDFSNWLKEELTENHNYDNIEIKDNLNKIYNICN